MDMHGEHIACLLCGASETTPWGSENGWIAVKCRNCGLVYVNPRPREIEISKANQLGEHRTAAGVLQVVHNRDAGKPAYHRKVLIRLFADLLARDEPVRWLDVGAGFGEVVEVLQALLPRGSVVEGIEPMRAKATNARKRGLPINSRLLSELPDRYHVISLINVFSHLANPRAFLGEVADHLLPRGELLIETGNGGDLDEVLRVPGPPLPARPLTVRRRRSSGAVLARCGLRRSGEASATDGYAAARHSLGGATGAGLPG